MQAMYCLNKIQFGDGLAAPHRRWIAAQERQQQQEQRFPHEEPNASGTAGFAGLASDALWRNRNRMQARTRIQSQQQQNRNDASASNTDAEALDDGDNPFAMARRVRPLPGLPFRGSGRFPYMGRLEREREREREQHKDDTGVIDRSGVHASGDRPRMALEALRPSMGKVSEDIAAPVEMMAQRQRREAAARQWGEAVLGYQGEVMDDGDKEFERTQDGKARARVWPGDAWSWTRVEIPMWKAEGVEGGGGVETKGITDKGTEELETGARAESEPADAEWDFVAATEDAEVDEGEGDDWCVVEKHLR